MKKEELNAILAKERKNRNIAAIVITIGFVLFFLNFAFVFIGHSFNFLSIVFTVVVLMLGFIYLSKVNNDIKKKVGLIVMSDVIADYFKDSSLNLDASFYIDLIDNIFMGFPSYDDIECNDYIKGHYRHHHIEIVDLKLEETHTSRNADGHTSRHTETKFKGPFIRIDYDKELSDSVTIFDKRFIFSSNKVETESIEFNENYSIVSSSEHDAFYILTPNMMEKIASLSKMVDTNIYLTFNCDGYIYLAIDNRHDSFEINMSHRDVDTIKREFFEEFAYLVNIIDFLIDSIS